MGTKSDNLDIVELGGRTFKRAKNGLDEGEVASFLNELISERDMLIKNQEHLSSLTALAERTVMEADNLAKQIQKEAEDKATVEANTIIAGAEERVQKMIEEKRAEAIAIATKEAEAITIEAKRQAGLMLAEKAKEISSQLREITYRQYSDLLAQLESLGQQVEALEVEFKHRLSSLSQKASTEVLEVGKGDTEFEELIKDSDQMDRDPEWRLQILPPLDIMQTLEVMNSLDRLPEIEKTELIPDIEKPSIIVFVRQPVQLIDMLRTLPQVVEVKEDATGAVGADGKPRKVQIALSGKMASTKGN